MGAGSRRFTLRIPPDVAEVIRRSPPDLERGIKAGLRALRADPREGVPLVRELEGLWRYRVRRYRVVYEIDSTARVLRLVAVGHRRDIYEQLAAGRSTAVPRGQGGRVHASATCRSSRRVGSRS